MADLNAKIKKQVEFYFSDSNFPKDKFLRASSAQNEEGYVPLSTVATFKKMKDITEDITKIVAALKDSDVVALNSDGTMIKRKHPLPENDTSAARSIYIKGWKEGTSMEDIEKFLTKFGKVLSVRIRKDKEKKPKDSAFVEFSTEDEAKAALAETIKYEEKDLLTMSRNAYQDKKKEERNARKEAKKAESGDKEEGEDGKGKKRKNNRNEKKEEKEHPKGVLLSFKNIGEGVTREILKSTFEKYGDIAFVDFSQNESEGVMRFKEPEVAKKALDGATAEKTTIGDKVPELALLADAEEEAYWKKVNDSKNNRRGQKGGRGKRRRF